MHPTKLTEFEIAIPIFSPGPPRQDRQVGIWSDRIRKTGHTYLSQRVKTWNIDIDVSREQPQILTKAWDELDLLRGGQTPNP